jgi:uncharacterized membrane protein YsdA (DUF1294 family)
MIIREILTLAILFWNIFVFSSYGLDKRRARRRAWRISERVLLMESLCFGGLGAILGGYFFHHKTRKWYFQICWYTGILVDVVTIYLVWRI